MDTQTLLKMALAESLRKLRQERGIAQERLAQLSGMDRAYVGGIERAKHSPRLDTIYRLADALSMTALDLLAEVDTCYRKLKQSSTLCVAAIACLAA